MKSKLSLGLLVVSLLLLSTTISFADQCVVLGKAQVETAKFFYLKNGATIYHYCKPCGDASARAEVINSVRFKQSGDSWEITVNEKAIDLAYVYVLTKGRYYNLANLVGCSTTDVPEYLTNEITKMPAPAPYKAESNNLRERHVYLQPFKNPAGHEDFLNSFEVTYELFYLFLKETFIFQDFNIYFKYCGQENAFSEPTGNIIICNEYVAKFVNQNLEKALPWIFFHEVGHSLLRSWDYPLWDNEDAADEFATVLLLMAGQAGKEIAIEAIREWKTHPSFFESIVKVFINDRHTVSSQRARNISSWINNSDELKRRWLKIFVPNMQIKTLKSMINKPESWMDIEFIEKELQKREILSKMMWMKGSGIDEN